MAYIGIDIGSATFAATFLTDPDHLQVLGEFENTPDGFKKLLDSLPIPFEGTLSFVMEATGVYSESLSHFLHSCGFAVYVEPPRRVKRAFYERGKTDPLDSRQIAEYGHRFPDQLHPWQPREAVLEQLRILATIKLQYTRMMTSLKNARKALQSKHQQYTTAIDLHTQVLSEFKTAGKLLEQEMKTLVKQNLILNQHLANLQTIPGVGFWIALNFLLITEGFTMHVNPKHLAAYIGICPYPYESGTSVKRPPHADSAGPARLRSLLYLASMTMSKNNPQMHHYYERKVKEGKSKRLVLNNIANKLLKLMCALIEHGKPYDEKFLSVNPNLF